MIIIMLRWIMLNNCQSWKQLKSNVDVQHHLPLIIAHSFSQCLGSCCSWWNFLSRLFPTNVTASIIFHCSADGPWGMYKQSAQSITLHARLLLTRLLITHTRFKGNRIPLNQLCDRKSSHKIPQALMINQHDHEQLSCVRIPADITDARLLHAYVSTDYIV